MIGFLKQTILEFRTTGAIAASSPDLCKLMVKTANIDSAKMIVEFGPGTGVISKVIMAEKPAQAQYFALEMNPAFVESMKKNCPEVTVFEDNALNLPKYLAQYNTETCDIVYSSLPWSLFSDELQSSLLDVIVQNLKPEGEFLTFAYIQGVLLPSGKRFRRKLEERFSKVERTHIIWRNAPPAFVYHAVK